MSKQEARPRPHPAERFAGDSHVFDLNEELRRLRAELHPGQGGHRQVTIFHRAPVSKVLFAFEANGELSDHAANGLVSIMCWKATRSCALLNRIMNWAPAP